MAKQITADEASKKARQYIFDNYKIDTTESDRRRGPGTWIFTLEGGFPISRSFKVSVDRTTGEIVRCVEQKKV